MQNNINELAEMMKNEDYTAALETMLDLRGADGQIVIQEALKRVSPNLKALCDTLNHLENAVDRFNEEGRYFFGPLRLDEVIDTSSLPTYDSDEPHNTTGIYSWDDKFVLTTWEHDDTRWVTTYRKDNE